MLNAVELIIWLTIIVMAYELKLYSKSYKIFIYYMITFISGVVGVGFLNKQSHI